VGDARKPPSRRASSASDATAFESLTSHTSPDTSWPRSDIAATWPSR
jgi:hypothetical protein